MSFALMFLSPNVLGNIQATGKSTGKYQNFTEIPTQPFMSSRKYHHKFTYIEFPEIQLYFPNGFMQHCIFLSKIMMSRTKLAQKERFTRIFHVHDAEI
jgi:hypothetical protein